MPQARTMTQSGLSAQNSIAVLGVRALGLTAAGTTQGSALPLPGDINQFATVAASAGTILPAMNGGDNVQVFNNGANALSIYPPVGGQINALAVNAPYIVATATPFAEVYALSATQYIARQSG